ncbi:MAG: peptidoglycan-associated lipoprotein [Acidobacteria bacterium]|nr:peptidoglycan-associated lipoprotein [Acidobacteriota bacterium]|tara:strand:+ start:8669 stop:9199 length:531 start_codon:yes stop_codon:yes gene_type:complete
MVLLILGGCSDNPPPVVPDSVPSPPAEEFSEAAPPPPPPIAPRVSPPVVPEDEFASRSLEELNRDSPLDPAYFSLDSSRLDASAQRVVEANAEVLRRYPNWIVTIEGHCDERGTPEYNLALGERRALATRQYLVELGLDPTRVRTVSYGKEFPFDPGHDDRAWAENRRAHFVITDR